MTNQNRKESPYALAVELALRCGLTKSEIANLKGEDINKQRMVIRVKEKGRNYREVPLPVDLLDQLDTSKPYLFPHRSWKSEFNHAVGLIQKILKVNKA